ncbi:hypothetical protein BGX28_009073 [Mortierella sp. GBA30]|nr:hypothetical protein BGX28_009073 [Mortierella sp. GBA30]
MFANSSNLNTTSASSAANPASSASDIAAESALFHTLFAMPATMNTINQDFCLFDADESSFDYPLFNGASVATTKSSKTSQPNSNSANSLNFFNNPLCTPQTPSIDLASSLPANSQSAGFGFDSCSAFLDDSTLTQQQQQALIDTPFTPYLDTPALLNTPLETPYLADFGLNDVEVKLEASAPLFSDFTFDFAFDNVYTIEPNMLLPVEPKSTLPSPSLSDSTLSSPPSSPFKDSETEFAHDDESDHVFVPSRSAALVSGLKRKAHTTIDTDFLAEKLRPITGHDYAAMKKAPAAKRFSCSHPGCDRRFARLFNLHTHEKTHDPVQSRPFLCSEAGCAKAFSRKHDLQRHEASVHKGERNFACSNCHKPFSRQDGLRRHLAVKGACSDNHWLTT